jgi:hypothetical protein
MFSLLTFNAQVKTDVVAFYHSNEVDKVCFNRFVSPGTHHPIIRRHTQSKITDNFNPRQSTVAVKDDAFGKHILGMPCGITKPLSTWGEKKEPTLNWSNLQVATLSSCGVVSDAHVVLFLLYCRIQNM